VPVPLSGTTKIGTAAAYLGGEDRLEIFAISVDGALYHGKQDTAAPTGWTALLQIAGDLLFAQVAVAAMSDGSTEAVAVSTGGQLHQISREPDTGDWLIDEIELPVRGAVEQYTSYTLQLGIADRAQLPAPGADITVYSDAPVRLEINGRTCFLDAATPWHGLAGQDGQLTIGMEAQTLSAPSLSVWTSIMPADDRILIEPSGAVRAQLAALDDAGATLLAAISARSDRTTYSTGQLVQGDANRKPELASWASQAVRKVMSLAGAP